MYMTGAAIESESNDRVDIQLPGDQLQLLKDATAAGMTLKNAYTCSEN